MPDCTAMGSVADLIESLRQCRLLSSSQLEELTELRHAEPRTLAQTLVERGLLTHYQANLLLQGRGNELVLEPYLVLARLGEGGSGLVLKARHRHMQRVVAIKLIRKALLTDTDVVARFQREIEVASQVSHANVVHAFDAGPMGSTLGLVMEYVEGIDLARLVKDDGPLPASRACDYVRQAALGMQHVHEKGLIHRDIKPSNLLVTSGKQGDAGIVKVLDLGLARLSGHKAQAASSQLTTMGSVMMGTPDYMAPEQAIDLRSADIRADVYSLGCTLFYLVTGQPPFPAGSLAQKLMKHQQAPVPSVHQFRPEAPKALDPILQKMLAKSPADRYQTPAEVVAALAPLASVGKRTSVRRSLASTATGKDLLQLPKGVAVVRRVPLWRRRRPLVLGVAGLLPAAAGLLLAAAGLTVLLAVSGPVDSGRAGGSQTAASQPTGDHAPPASPTPLEPLTLLGDPRGRHWGNVTALAFSQDSKFLASASQQGPSIHIWDAATLAAVKTLPFPSRHISAMALSPDGRRLAAACNLLNGQGGELKVWDVASGKELKTWTHPGAMGSAVAFSADGETVSLVNQRHAPPAGQVIDFRAWEVGTGNEKRPPVEAANSFVGRLSADGSLGLSFSVTGWTRWDLGKGTSDLEVAFGMNRGVPPSALTADGLTLFMATQRPAVVNGVFTHEIQQVDLRPLPADAGNRAQTHTLQEEHAVQFVVPGPGPQTVILWGRALEAAKGDALRLWNLGGGTPKRLAQTSLRSWVSVLALSPDGKTLALATNDGNLRLWDAATLVERLPDSGHRGAIQFLTFADGDRSLISTSVADATVRAWDHASGKERARLALTDIPGQWVNVASSADGAALAVWNHKAIRLLDPLAGKHHDLSVGADEGLQAVAVSPDGRSVAGFFVGNNLKFWNMAGGPARPSLPVGGMLFGQMVFSQDGKVLALASQRQENGRALASVRLVDVASGTERFSLPTNYMNLHALTMSPDARFLAVSGRHLEGNRVTQEWKVWEVATGKERPLPNPNALPNRFSLLFAPAGAHLAVWNNNHLQVWDVAAGKMRYNLTQQAQAGKVTGIRTVAFSRDGRRVVCAQNDGQVLLVDCATGSVVHEWSFSAQAICLAVSSDGRQVAVGSSNGLIQVHRLPMR
jgi:serine/threonine protein kinase/WD40 repeat protein